MIQMMLEKLLTALQSISNLKSILLEFGIILTAIATEHTLGLTKRKRKYAVLFLVKCIGFLYKCMLQNIFSYNHHCKTSTRKLVKASQMSELCGVPLGCNVGNEVYCKFYNNGNFHISVTFVFGIEGFPM